MREALAGDTDPPYRIRETSGGRYMAVTFQPDVQDAQQVIAIYRRLSVLEDLVMLW